MDIIYTFIFFGSQTNNLFIKKCVQKQKVCFTNFV